MADDTNPKSQQTTEGFGITVKASGGPGPQVGSGKVLRRTTVAKNPPATGKKSG